MCASAALKSQSGNNARSARQGRMCSSQIDQGTGKVSKEFKQPMNRKFTALLFATVFVSMAAFAQAPATSAPAGPAPTKIGIINLQEAIVRTNEGARDLKALQDKFQPKRTELESLSKELDGLKQQLNTQGDKLNDEAKANLARSIETKQKTYQRTLEDAQGDFNNQQGEIANHIGGKLLEVLDKYAKENGYAVVLNVSDPQQTSVVWAGPQIDLTAQIVTAYNAQSNVPAPAAATPAAKAPAAPRPTATTKPAPTTPRKP